MDKTSFKEAYCGYVYKKTLILKYSIINNRKTDEIGILLYKHMFVSLFIEAFIINFCNRECKDKVELINSKNIDWQTKVPLLY